MSTYLNANPTLFNVTIKGSIVASNLPSRMIAESIVSGLTTEQRSLAVITPVTNDGRQVLFG